MWKLFRSVTGSAPLRSAAGVTAIEYGLIAAGISVAIITVVNTLGSQLKSTFTNISSQLATAGK